MTESNLLMAASCGHVPGSPDEVLALLPEIIRKTGHADWRQVGRVLRRRECRIYFLGSGVAGCPGLVLKVYHPENAGRSPVRKLHKRSRLLNAGATDECAIPVPVLFNEAKHAIVMEYVDAPLAGSLLIRAGFSGRERARITSKAARWLRWFHDQTNIADGPFDAELFHRKVSKLMERFQSISPRGAPPGGFVGECVAVAGNFATALEGTLMPHATAHGDFTPFNLFIQDGRTIGFDYRANRRLPVYHDICRFLHYQDVYRFTPARAADVRKCGCRLPDFETFMEAYGTDLQRLDQDVWLKLHFMEITRRILSLSMPDAGLRKGFFRFIELAHLRRNARIILDALA